MKRFRLFAVLIAILLLGFALRLYRLDTVPFRGDEAFSVQRWAAIPLDISLSEIATIEPHPPLTYVIFRAWGLVFGIESEFALRMLPVLFNLLGIPALFALGKKLSGKNSIGLLAAFFWAIHPFQIWHAQDFRNYAIWAGLSAIVVYLGLRCIMGKRDWRTWTFYTFFASLSCLIFYNELLTIGVLGLFALLQFRDLRFVLRWSALNVGIIALTIAIFLIFQGDLLTGGGYGGTTGGFEPWQWWERFLPALTLGETFSLSLLQQFAPTTPYWPIVAVPLLLAAILVLWRKPQQGIFLLLLGIVPLLMLGLISTRLNIFRPRYVLLSAPAYTLLLSYALWILWRFSWGKILSTLVFIFWMALSLYSLNNYYFEPAYIKAPAWPELTQYLEENTQVGEAIIQTSVDPAFGYYYDLADISAGEFALPADVTQPIPDIITTMESTAENYHSIWIVGQTFPDWPNTGVVENWAFENLQLVRQTQIAGLPVHQFLGWDVLPEEISETPIAHYEVAKLMGAQIFPPEPSQELTIWLYWQSLAQTETALKVFVHLVGITNPTTGSPLWSQDDQFPQDGRISTSTWELNTLYRDVFVLPLMGVGAGEYQVFLGFYNPETNERLLLDDGSDAYLLGTIEIK